LVEVLTGIGEEHSANFIHLDVCRSKAQEVIGFIEKEEE